MMHQPQTTKANPSVLLREFGPNQTASGPLRKRHTGAGLKSLLQSFHQPYWDWSGPEAPQSDDWCEPHGAIFGETNSADSRAQQFLKNRLSEGYSSILVIAHENIGRLLSGATGMANAHPLHFRLSIPLDRAAPLTLIHEPLADRMSMGSGDPAHAVVILGCSDAITQQQRLVAGVSLLEQMTEDDTWDDGMGGIPLAPGQKYQCGSRSGTAACIVFTGSPAEWEPARHSLVKLLPPKLRSRVVLDWRAQNTLDNARRVALLLSNIAPHRQWVAHVVTNDWHSPRAILAGLNSNRKLGTAGLKWVGESIATTLADVVSYPTRGRERWKIDGAITALRISESHDEDFEVVAASHLADFHCIQLLASLAFATCSQTSDHPIAQARRSRLFDLITHVGDAALGDIATVVWEATMRDPRHVILSEEIDGGLTAPALARKLKREKLVRVFDLCFGF